MYHSLYLLFIAKVVVDSIYRYSNSSNINIFSSSVILEEYKYHSPILQPPLAVPTLPSTQTKAVPLTDPSSTSSFSPNPSKGYPTHQPVIPHPSLPPPDLRQELSIKDTSEPDNDKALMHRHHHHQSSSSPQKLHIQPPPKLDVALPPSPAGESAVDSNKLVSNGTQLSDSVPTTPVVICEPSHSLFLNSYP